MMDDVDPRLAALDEFVLTFAERGASAHAPANTMEAFQLGRELGADGISSTAWATADGVVVLNDRPHIGTRPRRRLVASMTEEELPDTVVTLPALYDNLDSVDLVLAIGAPPAFEAVVEAARAVGSDAERRLWLTSPDLDQLIEWRTRTSARLVNAIPPRRLTSRPEQLAAELRRAEVDGLQLFHQEWNGGLVAMMHRFGRYALGWGLEHEREIAKALRTGIDAICGQHPDRLAAACRELYPGR